tara:strand:+ start:1586 stop:1879 length:294 start_codon:yes stop_codon:yes gene_type:complete
MWFSFKSGSLNDLKDENFCRRKNWREDTCEFYDFTAFKISEMIYDLLEEYADHPDLDALSIILSMYMSGDVEVAWKEGYPMPYLKGEKFFDDDYGLE